MKDNTRAAVVTGGTQGIGRQTAELLAQRGYRIAIIDLHQPSETVKAIEAEGGAASISSSIFIGNRGSAGLGKYERQGDCRTASKVCHDSGLFRRL